MPARRVLSGSTVARVRATVLAGALVGLVVGGVGGRLAMFLLRHTSADFVDGMTSDDGFEIGQVTLAGTYALLGVSVGIGIVGAVGYRLVAPWLIGPPWFRRLTTAAGAGAVVGAMLVHADGVDFTVLGPRWLAIGLFVAIPAAFGASIGAGLAWLERPDAWPNRTRLRWWASTVAPTVAFPPLLVVVAFVAVGATVWHLLRPPDGITWIPPLVRLGVRGAWLAVAVLGLVALVSDVRAIA